MENHVKIDFKAAEWLSELFQMCSKLRAENTQLQLELLSLNGKKQNNLWQLIETAPKDGTELLLYFGDEWGGIAVGHFGHLEEYNHETDNYEIEVCWQSGLEKRNPTHWMQIPKSPELLFEDKTNANLSIYSKIKNQHND